AGRKRRSDHFAERASVVIRDPARELQDLGIADWLGVDERVRILYIDFAKLGWKLIVKTDDVTGDEIAAERHDEARADFCLNTLFGAQAISERLKDMQRNCDFSV